jgi:hypothetical protein
MGPARRPSVVAAGAFGGGDDLRRAECVAGRAAGGSDDADGSGWVRVSGGIAAPGLG